ncbi:MAG: glycosyltransferase [Alsobacter sp.]
MTAAQGVPQEALDGMVAQVGTFYFDELRHRLSLPLLARWLHLGGRDAEALRLLQRYWRTGSDGVADRLLEAAIRESLDGAAAAQKPLRRALAIDPTDPAVQRRLLRALAADGRWQDARALAGRLAASARDPAVLALALEIGSPDWQAFGLSDLSDGWIEGWCVWKTPEESRPYRLLADGRSASFTLEAQPHPVWEEAGARFAAFRFRWPEGASIVELRDGPSGALLRGGPMMNDEILDRRLPPDPGPVDVTVIIPVYADAAATRLCFDSLLADRESTVRRRIVAVDDASPDAMIRAFLDQLAQAGSITLLRNPQNVGFIRTVNRALRLVRQEDVVLLNADTIVPPGWLDRLNDAAQDPDVGTVTPLSNNGEFVSVPNKFCCNPMPDAKTLLAIDAAARAMGAAPIDLPNGIGFCLYVRNDALRAVGGLDSRHYEKGYLEEVDFCLRVSRAGWRNVCAPNVYVAHQGEASFGAQKRELVVGNAAALVKRWPDIEARTSAFVRDDPLHPLRATMAWAGLSSERRRRLVVAEDAVLDPAVESRLRALDPRREIVVLAATEAQPKAWRVRLPGIEAALNLPESTCRKTPVETLSSLIDAVGAEDAVLVLSRRLPKFVGEALAWQDIPFDLMPWEQGGRAGPELCKRARRALLCAASARAELSTGHRLEIVQIEPPGTGRTVAAMRGEAIGIIPSDGSAATFGIIRALALALHRRGSSRSLVVFGETFRDVGLMRLGNVFVTGPLYEEDWPEALASHGCGALVALARRRLYAHHAFDVLRRCGLPYAVYPTGAAAELLREVPDGLAMDESWSPDEWAFVADTFLSASALSSLTRRKASAA